MAKECCLVGSQNAMQRCETTLELFCVSFMFLAFLHAVNLQSASYKKERLYISSVMVREGNINFELMLPGTFCDG